MSAAAEGPLHGLRVLEFAGIGPGPHCAMLLADMGAEVLRIEREGGNGWPNPVADRGRRVLALDIRSAAGRARCLELAAGADVLIEGFRPGVMEAREMMKGKKKSGGTSAGGGGSLGFLYAAAALRAAIEPPTQRAISTPQKRKGSGRRTPVPAGGEG